MKVPDIKTKLPGPKAQEVIRRDKDHLVLSTKVSEFCPDIGYGCVLEDIDGNKFLDFSAGIAVANLGYSHPRIIKVIKNQAEKLIHGAGQDFYNKPQTDYAEALCSIGPGKCDKKIFFCNSGTESVEAAAKIARWNRSVLEIVSFIGAFHGRTMGSLAFTASKPIQQKRFLPTIGGVHIPYAYCYRCVFKMEYPSCGLWCADYLKEVCFETFLPPEEVAAVIVEPIQCEGGYIVPPPEFLPKIKKTCEQFGILYISDEVQTGFGRTGKWWGVDHYNIVPDITCVAKSIAAGVPMGATIVKKELDFTEKGAHSNTYGGNLLACATALESIQIIKDENLIENASKIGTLALKQLIEFKEDIEIVGDVRGQGLMIGVEIVKNKETKEPAKKATQDIIQESFKKGLILLPCGKSVIRLIPPLIIDEETLQIGLEIFEKVLKNAKV